MLPVPRRRALLPALLLALVHAGCGGGGAAPGAAPFSIDAGVSAPPPTVPPGATPPPAPDAPPTWDADAATLGRTASFGSFPSDLALLGSTLFVVDADQIEADGARVLAFDVSGPVPQPSAAHVPFTLHVADLVDATGAPADLADPIGFGFYVNDLLVVDEHLGFLLVNAGGSDSPVALSNLVVFDPTTGELRQRVNLATEMASAAALVDSGGTAAANGRFVQSQAEALAWVPSARRLYVALANILVGAPGYGTLRQRGTVQVYDVAPADTAPVRARFAPGLATETLLTQDYNPVALALLEGDPAPGGGAVTRLLVTCGGTTAYDAQFNLAPVTPASVEAFDADTAVYLGRFGLGLVGLAGTPPALGRDAAGHRVGFFASSVTGQVYLLRLDGLASTPVDASRLAVLRGPGNGLPITAAQSGGPGGNLAGLGLSPDGRTLVVSGFGDLFAGVPGQLALLRLPDDLLTGSGLGTSFVPGSTLFATVPGRTLGGLRLRPGGGVRPDVFVLVSGHLDPLTFVGTSAASVGTLTVPGLVR